MKKQAYLLTAYKDYEAVSELASFLCKKDEVFIHVDLKSKGITDEQIDELNKLESVEAFREFPIYWGGYNHVKALLSLMRKASLDSNISYIHMLTGEDFPLFSPEELHERFVEDHHIYLDYIEDGDFNDAVKKRYLYYNYFQNKNVKNKWLWLFQDFTVKLQKMVGVKRTQLGGFTKIYKGLVYISMPIEAVRDVLTYIDAHPEYVKDMYKCQLPEEFFFHTLLLSDEFMDGKWKNAIVKQELRYMNWERGDGGSPVYLEMEDFEQLANGKYFFARKFHGKESKELKNKIKKELW